MSTHGIPRFIMLAVKTYNDAKQSHYPLSPHACLDLFYHQVRLYYDDCQDLLLRPDFPPDLIARIILATLEPVIERHEKIPNTSFSWNDLQDKSLVFPFSDNHFTIPLIFWLPQVKNETKLQLKNEIIQRWRQIDKALKELVSGLDIETLFINLHEWVEHSSNQNWIGLAYEQLLSSMLAVRYFKRVEAAQIIKASLISDLPFVPLSALYDDLQEDTQSEKVFSRFFVDFSGGIIIPTKGAAVLVKSIPINFRNSIILNKETTNAHHDIVFYGKRQEEAGQIDGGAAIQAKNSCSRPDGKDILKQLDDSSVLIWAYLDADDNFKSKFETPSVVKAIEEDRFALISGKGLIHPHTMALLQSLKQALYVKEKASSMSPSKKTKK
jgi:hypothetical protein